MARRLAAHGAVDREDLVQAAAIALGRARETFDPSRGVKWASYAQWRARGAMLDALREIDHVPRLERARARAAGRELPEVLSMQGDAVDVASQGGDRATTPAADELAARRDLWAELPRLVGRRGAEVLRGCFLDGLTLLEIGRELGISESRTSQIRARALRVLRSRVAQKWGPA